MASEADHISLANRNHDCLLHLLQHGYLDWCVTVAFYKAVHLVEAVFAYDMHRNSTSHDSREQALKIPKYKAIFMDYKHLNTASRVARYLEDSGAGAFSKFSDYMDGEDVKKVIRARLYGVEQKSLQFLSPASRAALKKIDPATIV